MGKLFKWIVEPRDQRGLAVAWMAVTSVAGLAGLLLALLIRAELAGPDIQVFSDPAQYASSVSAHGLLMYFCCFLPMLIGGFGHLVLPALGGREQAHVTLGSRIGLAGFIVALALITVHSLPSLMPSGASQAASTWSAFPHSSAQGGGQGGFAPGPVWALVLSAALLFSILGLAWTLASGGGRVFQALSMTGGGQWMTAALAAAAFCVVWHAADHLMLARHDGSAAGAEVSTMMSGLDVLALTALLGGVGIVLTAAGKASDQPGFLWPVTLIALLLLTAGFLLPHFDWWHQVVLERPLLASTVLDSRLSVPVALVAGGSLLSLLLARPLPVLVAGWTAGFFGILLVGIAAIPGTEDADLALRETMYTVAELHLVGPVPALLGFAAALVAYFPSLSNSLGTRVAGWISIFLTVAGVLLTFLPMYWLGLMGMPRRHIDYPQAFASLNEVSSFGSALILAGVCAFSIGIILAMRPRKAVR